MDIQKEVKIAINSIREIELVETKVPKQKVPKQKITEKREMPSFKEVIETAAYVAPYLPLIPIAVVSAPIIIPATKSFEMKSRKAELIYQGMTKDELRQIYNKFFRAQTEKTVFSGLGLGMAIVKNIVESHDGTIDIVSQRKVGTTVTVAFPKSADFQPQNF